MADQIEGRTDKPALQTVGEALDRVPNLLDLIEPNESWRSEAEPTAEPKATEADGEPTTEPETVLSQPETEPPVEPSTEAEPESDGLTPEQEARIQKRIEKEIGKRKTLSEELERTRAELAAAKAAAPAPPPTNTPPPEGTVKVPELEAVDKAEKEAQGVVAGARTLLRQMQSDPEAALDRLRELKLEFRDQEAARDWLEDQRDAAVQVVAKQAARRETLTMQAQQRFQQQMQQFDAQAKEDYAWHADKDSPQFKRALEIVKSDPSILQRPDRLLFLGALVEGQLAREARKGAVAAPLKPSKPAPPKLPGASSHSPVAQPASATTRQAVQKRAFQNPRDKEAVGEFLSSLVE